MLPMIPEESRALPHKAPAKPAAEPEAAKKPTTTGTVPFATNGDVSRKEGGSLKLK